MLEYFFSIKIEKVCLSIPRTTTQNQIKEFYATIPLYKKIRCTSVSDNMYTVLQEIQVKCTNEMEVLPILFIT